jgi:hypothetical protein
MMMYVSAENQIWGVEGKNRGVIKYLSLAETAQHSTKEHCL